MKERGVVRGLMSRPAAIGLARRAGRALRQAHGGVPWLTRAAVRIPGADRLVGPLMLLGREKSEGLPVPERGLPGGAVLGMLDLFKSFDMDPSNGRVFAYIYDAGRESHQVSAAAFVKFLKENGLDPTVYPSVMGLENEVVELAKSHVSAGPEVVGNFTSGGTESIILAIKAARDHAREHRPKIRRPKMVVPVTAHSAFQKAAEYLCVESVRVPVDPKSMRADPEAMREAIDKDTILLVASAPSYAHGVVDPVPEIAALARERGLLCHVDACVGGFLLHYLRRLGVRTPDYDFSLPGVTSLSMDLHKYGFAPKGASIVLYRGLELRRHAIFAFSDWTGYSVINPTLQSSRSGGPVAAAWATLNFLGQDGYLAIARAVLNATRQLIAGIESIPGLSVLGRPDMNLVAAASAEFSVFHLADEMRARGWYIQPQLALGPYRENVHFSIGPAHAATVGPMIDDLRKAVSAVRGLAPSGLPERVRERFGDLAPDNITDEVYEELLGMAGIRGSDVPERMAPINEVLNTLRPATADRLLTHFYNRLNRYNPDLLG